MARKPSSPSIDVALLNQDVALIKTSVNKIEARLELMANEYIKRAEVAVLKESLEKSDSNIQAQIFKLQDNYSTEIVKNAVFQSQVRTWGLVGSIIMGIVSPVIVTLIINFVLK